MLFFLHCLQHDLHFGNKYVSRPNIAWMIYARSISLTGRLFSAQQWGFRVSGHKLIINCPRKAAMSKNHKQNAPFGYGSNLASPNMDEHIMTQWIYNINIWKIRILKFVALVFKILADTGFGKGRHKQWLLPISPPSPGPRWCFFTDSTTTIYYPCAVG